MKTGNLSGRCLLIVVGLLLGVSASRARPPEIKIHGNQVIIDEVYRAVIELPAGARADAATARLVEKQLAKFLRRAGYLLATVKARAAAGAIQVEMEEGRVEKVVFLGAGTLRTLRLKLDLKIPHHVFNRPNLVRQLKYLGRKHGVKKVTYRLVPCQHVEHQGPQVDDIGQIQGHTLIPPEAHYELHIRFGQSEWGSGLGVDLEYDFPDGLVLGTHYKGQGLIFRDDRWRVGAKAGGEIREKLQSGDPKLALTRASAEVKWYAPALAGGGLRPFLWIQSDLNSRQRGDLNVEVYYRERLEASLNLEYEIVPGLKASVGGGAWGRLIFGVHQLEGASTSVEESQHFRPLLLGRIDVVFNPQDARRDRSHRLTLDARHYWVADQTGFGKGDIRYQKVFSLGWHDLWIKTRGAWLWGNVLFDDEEPVGGRYLRGTFGNRYVHKVAGLTLEFRLSLARDLFKLGIFNDLAVFGELDRVNGGESLRVADSFGLGFHALILDSFQLDIYYAFGFSSEDDFDHGPSAYLKKVF